MLNSKGGKLIQKVLDSNHIISSLLIIGFIIGACIAIYVIDYTPATENDYKPLLEIQDNIIKDFDSVYNYPDADINMSKSTISVSVKNEECGLNIIFDKDKNYLYTEKDDYSASVFIFIFGILLYGVILSGGFMILSSIGLIVLQSFLEWLYEKHEKKKNQKANNSSRDIDH